MAPSHSVEDWLSENPQLRMFCCSSASKLQEGTHIPESNVLENFMRAFTQPHLDTANFTHEQIPRAVRPAVYIIEVTRSMTVKTQNFGFIPFNSARYFVPSFDTRGEDTNRFVEVHVKDVFPYTNPALIVENHNLRMSFKPCEKHIFYGGEMTRTVRLISNPMYGKESSGDARWVTGAWLKFGNVPNWGT